MFKPLPLYVGLRYTRAKRRNHFISFITIISMLGIALGVTALITVISVMNGFEQELRERILGMTAHATIQGQGSNLENWQSVAAAASENDQVKGFAPFIAAEGMLSFGSQVNGAIIRGVLPKEEPKVSEVGDKMLFGSLDDLKPGKFGIVLGKDLARILGVFQGDKVTLIIPQVNVTPAGVMPRLKRFTVVGIFEVGMYEYDSTLALMHLDDAARLFQMKGQVTGVRLKLEDMFKSGSVTRDLIDMLPGNYFISDWTREHANFFRAVKMEKTVMFFILMLIVAVAAFNLISTLVMGVVEKEADIAILRTLGASPSTILGIFVVQGIIIGVIGTLIGTAGGVALSLNIESIVPFLEHLLGFKFLAADVYYISELPSDLKWNEVFAISSISLVLSLGATLY
ncbi:MAG: lipoprotein-releasing ABC transporter permease subunit, partial [Gammaproteobacteria bacterium]|nr:lipoprotein-releasing ABC transporter permease subunit [Gammaproteobacteria bacterium]